MAAICCNVIDSRILQDKQDLAQLDKSCLIDCSGNGNLPSTARKGPASSAGPLSSILHIRESSNYSVLPPYPASASRNRNKSLAKTWDLLISCSWLKDRNASEASGDREEGKAIATKAERACLQNKDAQSRWLFSKPRIWSRILPFFWKHWFLQPNNRRIVAECRGNTWYSSELHESPAKFHRFFVIANVKWKMWCTSCETCKS